MASASQSVLGDGIIAVWLCQQLAGLSVAVEKLSADDRIWLRDNEKWVSLYGKKLEEFYVPAAADNGK